MTFGDMLRGRVQAGVSAGTAARAVVTERVMVIALGVSALLSALIYLVLFTLPYNLIKFQSYTGLDLERLQIRQKQLHWVLLLALFAQGALYWFAWQAARQARGRAAWAVVIGGTLLSAGALLFMYPIGSTDIFDYIIHGRMVGIHQANPFVSVARQFAKDPFARYVGWPNATSAYGGLWEILAGFTARLAGNGFVANVVAFKLIEVLALGACGAVVALLLRRAAPERALSGVLLLTWNPIVLYETVGNGHNDILMMLTILAAALAIYYRRYTSAILLLVAGVLIKFIPALLLPAAGLIALRELPDWRARLRFLVITGVLSAALVVICYEPFWHGLGTLAISRREKMFTSSLPTLIMYTIQPQLTLNKAMSLVSKTAALATLLFSLWQGLRAWLDRSWLSFTRSAYNISVFYLLFAVLWLFPWYSLWPLALAALMPVGGATLLANVIGFNFSLRPFVYAYLVLHLPGRYSVPWVEMRMSPVVVGAAWVTFLGLAVNRGISWSQGVTKRRAQLS